MLATNWLPISQPLVAKSSSLNLHAVVYLSTFFHVRADDPILFLEIPVPRISGITVSFKNLMAKMVYNNNKSYFVMITSPQNFPKVTEHSAQRSHSEKKPPCLCQESNLQEKNVELVLQCLRTLYMPR